MGNDHVIYLSNVRLSFPHLIEPQIKVNEKTGKERTSYNCDLILPQDHPGFVQFMKAYTDLALENWKEICPQVMQHISTDRKLRCFGKGEEKVSQKTMQMHEGYVGNVYIHPSSDTAPQIFQADGKSIERNNTMAYQQLTRAMYAGCYVHAAIQPWLQKHTKDYPRGVRCNLIALQFAADGQPFGDSVIDVSSKFGAIAPATQTTPLTPVSMGLPSYLTT